MTLRNSSFLCAAISSFCLGFIALSVSAARPANNPDIRPFEVTLQTDKQSYKLSDSITVRVFLTNKAHTPMYISKLMDFGESASFTLRTVDAATGKDTPIVFLADALPPPPMSKESFIEIWPGDLHGTSFTSKFSGVNITKAGNYKLTVEYHNPIPQSYSFGLATWSSEMGPIESNTVTISVSN